MGGNNGKSQVIGSWRLFVDALGRINFAIDGGIAIAIGIILDKYVPEKSAPLWIVVPAGAILVAFIIALTIALARAVDQARQIDAQQPTRTVKSVVPFYPPYPECSCILIVKCTGTAALASNIGVTISIVESTHERPLGFGTVRDMQEDGSFVITLDSPHDNAHEYIARILTTPDMVGRLRIGAQLSFQHLDAVRSPLRQGSTTTVKRSG